MLSAAAPVAAVSNTLLSPAIAPSLPAPATVSKTFDSLVSKLLLVCNSFIAGKIKQAFKFRDSMQFNKQ